MDIRPEWLTVRGKRAARLELDQWQV